MVPEQDKIKLQMWKERLDAAESAYRDVLDQMEQRETLYNGSHAVTPLVEGDERTETAHSRNIIAEMIESQVSPDIPQPKVTARRQKDEHLAKLIEDMLRNELDRMPSELILDMMERTVPLQGGGLFVVEWDNTIKTQQTVGEVVLSSLHPKQVIPQDGVTASIEDMDYIFVKLPQTKSYIKRRYGVDVSGETEEEPEIRGGDDSESDETGDNVTLYIAYYRGDDGGIGMYGWVNDTVVIDIDNYQTRRAAVCENCGGTEADEDGRCVSCGAEMVSVAREYEEITDPIRRGGGLPDIEGGQYQQIETGEADELGAPVMSEAFVPNRIPYYVPNVYPVILQRNVSVYGQFLGESDCDKLVDQQNTINVIEDDIINRLLKGGSYVTLPNESAIPFDARRKKVFRISKPDERAMFDSIDLTEDIEQGLTYLDYVYNEAKNIIGVTDSYLGRVDKTATSGKAKQFSASQAAGRLESKRVLKAAAWASVFELIFKYHLAYDDEPRPVVAEDLNGNVVYEEFNRMDFIERDEAGEYFVNDQFLFSCDTTQPLASNREAMWQEARLNFQSGTYGDPTSLDTQLLFWRQMSKLHYPLSDMAVQDIERRIEIQRQQRQQQMELQKAQEAQRLQQAQMQQGADAEKQDYEIRRQAQQDAKADAMAMAGGGNINAVMKGGE